ncbi:hypothetical protein HCN44_000462 [Aphidius gifuensis]|uniref:Uncharacterized protein n=1 Tax=Aphidius gifuensis TaxID=684658 RepID=A0A834XQA5_APHGI|nr:hypothetical protein HCN44_000462 [Aphidius gifuensis]
MYEQVGVTSATLKVALFFQNLTTDWLWIADEFYKKALEFAEKIDNDDGQILNTIKFLYGKYIFKNFYQPVRAFKYLSDAWKASKVSKNWNSKNVLGFEQVSLFQECSNILYQVSVDLASESRRKNVLSFALKMSVSAFKHALESKNEEYILKALYELGKCQIACDDAERSLDSFSKYLSKVKRNKDAPGIKLEDDIRAMKLLLYLRYTAEQYKLPEKLADAYLFIGECLLEQQKSNLAKIELEISFTLFRKLGNIKKMDKTRFLVGIARGQEIEKQYMVSIINTKNF